MNGEAIYATRPREASLWKEGEDLRFTRSKDLRTVWVFALKWPGRELALTSVNPRTGSEVRLLGYPQPLAWRTDPGKGVVVDIPDESTGSGATAVRSRLVLPPARVSRGPVSV